MSPPSPYLKMARQVRLNVRSVLVILLTVGILFISNLFLQADLLTSITTKRFWNIWGSKSAENIQNDGGALGCVDWPWQCTRSHNLVSPAVFGHKNSRCGPHSPNLPQIAPCNFFLFLRMKLQQWRCHFQDVLKFRNDYWLSYMHFHKVSSIGASSTSRNAGLVACT